MPRAKSMMWRTDEPLKRSPTDLSTALEDAPTEGQDLISAAPSTDTGFRPPAPETLEDTGLCDTLVESLLFKYLLSVGHQTGRGVATALGMPPRPIIELLATFKARQLVFHKDSTAIGDFEYALTDAGRERARTFADECAYVGPAPVPLEDYVASVHAQSITNEHPGRDDLERAFGDLLINEKMLERLGPAINSGRGLFLYGPPGNGKTSIAERITDCFSSTVWVPHAVIAAGEIITFYDPENHVAVGSNRPSILETDAVDARWIEIKRPTIIAGGELTMEALDLAHNRSTNVTESSLQLKSNTGALVIDDFGRQRVSTIELLNRWTVPLEKRFDFLTLATGKKIKVPFDQLIVFSTNLEPKDLVDEAFLRRIPYKIYVGDPTESEFRRLFHLMGPITDVEVDDDAVDRLIQKHYKDCLRSFRCCHPRDLLLQVKNLAAYTNAPAKTTDEALDAAVENYFADL